VGFDLCVYYSYSTSLREWEGGSMILDTSSILVLKYGRHVPPVTNTGACVHVVQRVPSGVPQARALHTRRARR
jgi:hypothetical protein